MTPTTNRWLQQSSLNSLSRYSLPSASLFTIALTPLLFHPSIVSTSQGAQTCKPFLHFLANTSYRAYL